MRHWFCALSARPTSRKERVLPKSMSAKARMNRRCNALAWPASRPFRAARFRSSSIGSNAALLSASDHTSAYSYCNRNHIGSA